MNDMIRTTPHRRGFSLMEVLIAMGIFTIGFVSVAALFPSAILLQKRTIQNVEAEQVARNVEALVGGRPYRLVELQAEFGNPPAAADRDRVLISPDGTPVEEHWSLEDRGYLGDFAANGDPAEADYVWVPLFVFESASTSWQAYVFVTRRDPTATFSRAAVAPADAANFGDPATVPLVERYAASNGGGFSFSLPNAEDLLNVGDPVLLSRDAIGSADPVAATVREIDTGTSPTTVRVNSIVPSGSFDVWLATPSEPGGASPGREIVLIEDIAQ